MKKKLGDNGTKICGTSRNTKDAFTARTKMDNSMQSNCNCLEACESTEYPWEIEQIQLNSIVGKDLNET